MNKVIAIACLLVLNVSTSICQVEESVYDRVFKVGDEILQKASKGDFSYFTKNQDDKAEFSKLRLELYRNDLDKKLKRIIELRAIEPSKKSEVYFYQSVVFNYEFEKPADYYYVAILLIHDDGKKAEVVNSWIMTEMEAFKNWWLGALGFFESESFKNVPSKYQYVMCPPPPQ